MKENDLAVNLILTNFPLNTILLINFVENVLEVRA